MANIDYHTVRKPRWGSDYALAATGNAGGTSIGAFMVIDTVGADDHPEAKRYVKHLEERLHDMVADPDLSGADDLHQRLRAELLSENQQILAMNPNPRRRIFGYGLAAGLIYGDEFRSLSLGDCRIYHFLPSGENTQGPLVRCLTRDHNRLQGVLNENDSYAFYLRNEMQELGRTLTCWWGYPDLDLVEKLLDEQAQSIRLRSGEVVLLVTDGIFMPIVRSLLDDTGFRLNRLQFSLEPWLAEFVDEGGYFEDEGRGDGWRNLLPDMVTFARSFSSMKPRYSDSRAGLAICYQDDE